MKQVLRLSQAVLASTLFIVPFTAIADIVVNAPEVNVSHTTGAPDTDGNIQVTNTGQILNNSNAVNNGDAILVNTAGQTITLDPNNATAGNAAIVTALTGNNGITITGGNSSSVTVGNATKITTIGNAIFVDSSAVDVDNAGIITGSIGINASGNGSTFLLVNESTGTIGVNVAANPAVSLNGANANVSNFGTISGGGGILAGGQNIVIANQTGGVITGTTTAGVQSNATGLQLANAGTISGTGAGGDGIQLNQNFLSVTNLSTGTISSTAASGINIAAAVSGDIQNSGTITSAGGAAAGIVIGADYTGSITNNAGGIIQTTNGTGSDAILIKGAFTNINNSGTIQGINGTDSAISVLAGVTGGTINNSGIIQSNLDPAISLGGNLTQINNTAAGSILTLGNATAAINTDLPNVTLTGGIVNSGLIQNGIGVGTTAIDLQNGGAGINVKLTQNGGIIDGKVLLASAGGSIFDMNGGEITGDVVTSALAGSTLNLNGGIIDGNLTLQSAAGNTVNIAGTALNTVTSGAGVDTFNLTAGTFNTITGGAGDILNVKATYSTSGDIIDVPTVNVTAGTFTANNKLTGFTNLNVGPNASMSVNSNTVTGNAAAVVVNANSILSVVGGNQLDTGGGSILVNNGGSLLLGNSAATIGALANTYVQNVGGNFSPTIQGTGNFGKMDITNNATLNAGSFVTPILGTGEFIPNGTTFDIITTGTGVVDNSTLNQPPSLTQRFTKAVVGNNLRLTSQRTGFSPLANTGASTGVAGALDTIAQQPAGLINAQILAVLGQLDLIGNQSQLVDELESLAPPVNYGLIAATHVSMDQMFRSIRRRLEDMRYLKTLGAESYQIIGPSDMRDNSGYNYGDSVHQAANQGAWIQGYGAVVDQRFRNEVEGYLGDASGFAIGMDWGRQGALVGGALNFTQSHFVGQTEDENVQNVQSVQGSVYSWIDLTDDVYMDTQAGFAMHHYKTRRNIGIGTVTTAGFGDFYGVHFGAQTEIGYAFLYDNLIVAPLTRFRYTRMSIDDYSENGAGGLSLTVQNQGLNEFIGGIGLRVVGKKEFAQAVYAPEASFMLAYDFYADAQATSSRFLGGGPVFPTIGNKPPQTMMLIDLGVNVHTYDSYIFTVKGELDLRDHYYGYSGWVNLYRSW